MRRYSFIFPFYYVECFIQIYVAFWENRLNIVEVHSDFKYWLMVKLVGTLNQLFEI